MNYPSLCVLSYNRPEYFANSMWSMHDNSDIPYELIIHDDGSDPGTIYEYLMDMHTDGATVILNKAGHNQGQGVSLNRLFNIASGDYIFKLDADIDYEPNWLSKTVKIMEDNPEIGLLGLVHYYHDPCDSRKTIIKQHEEWSEHPFILGSAFCVRRETWEELGPFEEHSDAFAEDNVFQTKVHKFSRWKVALPKTDLVKNNAMGIPHSTIVLQDHPNFITKKIHKCPYLLETDSVPV